MGNNLHSFPFRRFRVTLQVNRCSASLFPYFATLSSFLSIYEKSSCDRPFLRLCFAPSFPTLLAARELRRSRSVAVVQPTVTI